MPLTSIVVPVYALNAESADMAVDCLRAFQNTTRDEDVEIIAVDNGCVPQLVRLMDVADHYVRCATNRGFAGGVHEGLYRARGDVLAIGSADTFPRPGWLPPMRAAVLKRQGLATPAEYGPDGKRIAETGKTIRRRGDFFGNLMVVPRAVYAAVGGLDVVNFPLCFADTDFAIRVRAAGYPVFRVPVAGVVQEAKHHALPFMEAADVEAERVRLVEKWGHRFYPDWLAAQ